MTDTDIIDEGWDLPGIPDESRLAHWDYLISNEGPLDPDDTGTLIDAVRTLKRMVCDNMREFGRCSG